MEKMKEVATQILMEDKVEFDGIIEAILSCESYVGPQGGHAEGVSLDVTFTCAKRSKELNDEINSKKSFLKKIFKTANSVEKHIFYKKITTIRLFKYLLERI